MSPPVPGTRLRSTSEHASSSRSRAWRMSVATSCAVAAVMNASPSPVADTAQTPSSAQVPAPGSGASPTRPGIWPFMPPVDVAAARWPAASSATAPTVSASSIGTSVGGARADSAALPGGIASGPLRLGGALEPLVADALEPGLVGERARRRSPTISTCGVPSSTVRASATGWRTPVTAAHAPARRPMPSMIAASSSTVPSAVDDRAAAGVELGRVLERLDGGLHGVERLAAPLEDLAAGAQRVAQRGVDLRPRPRGATRPAPPCTTMTGIGAGVYRLGSPAALRATARARAMHARRRCRPGATSRRRRARAPQSASASRVSRGQRVGRRPARATGHEQRERQPALAAGGRAEPDGERATATARTCAGGASPAA